MMVFSSDLLLPRGRVLSLRRMDQAWQPGRSGSLRATAPCFSVMGIVNLTPDSFHEASRRPDPVGARDEAMAMVAAGAAIIDLGGESTRPGSLPVPEDEELSRVLPAIEAIRAVSDIPISVDTRHATVAGAALAVGADIINDISALSDPRMAGVVAGTGAAIVLMHMQGEPGSMQNAPAYLDVLAEVRDYLARSAQTALDAGIRPGSIILDPGIGFGKLASHNLALMAGLDSIAALGYHLLVGISRKRVIGEITGKPVQERLAGSLGAACAAWAGGASILRVHDVPQTVDALACFVSCLSGSVPECPES